ncbi:branched-chain amino acid aminotransferase II [Epithele typhae]|uniref:branched-chain amino acid aminotransferase II n=1 Tax=Epithele typhae TaxID=378194 RepID=UPI002007E05B|nr:branched-chain amino acid aminotransferase II [Epithele typhae]KAH9944546.1 branched-chain amino acid aminotransferase II [Epithele typhae]
MASTLRSARLALLRTPRLSQCPSRAGRLAFARWNSTLAQDPITGERVQLPDVQPSLVQITKTKDPKPVPSPSGLVFGHTFTDHMLTIPWHILEGWGTPKIMPYADLALPPSATVFHYAHCLFEGMKAYRDESGRVTLFRPDMNMKRMNNSASRIALPQFDGEAMIDLMKQLIRLDKHWIPKQPGYSVYVRPTLIGTQPALGITPPKEALFFIICSPVGPYFPQGFKPIALYGTTEFTRASPGGIGAYKLGANYAAGIAAQKVAMAKGYVQNLWLHGPEHYITEVGAMNVFVAFKRPGGVTELVTPPLDGVILPGVTRDSVLALARDHAEGRLQIPDLTDELVISERQVTMGEVRDAARAGEVVEFFGAGTAAVISPVDRIGYLGEDVHIPTGEDGMGPLSRPLWKYLTGIQTGKIDHPWCVEVTRD